MVKQRPCFSKDLRMTSIRIHPRLASRFIFAGLLTCCASSATQAAAFAYVPNQASGSISVIDTAKDEVVRTLQGEGKLGKRVRGVVVDHDDKMLFAIDAEGGKVNVVDIATDKLKQQIAVGHGPEGIGMSPSGNEIAACVEDDNWVTLIDAKTLAVTKHIPIKGKNPEHCVYSPDGHWLLTSNENSNDVDVIDLKAGASLGTVKGSGHPRGMAFLPGTTTAYVAAETGDAADIIDVIQRKTTFSIPTALRAAGATASPDGKFVYIANGGAGSVSVIDVAAKKVVAQIPVGKRPWNMAITHDGKKLYVANGRSNNVSVIDTSTQRVIKEISVGELPWGVTIP
jgi:YVTN family beta-propeller protein